MSSKKILNKSKKANDPILRYHRFDENDKPIIAMNAKLDTMVYVRNDMLSHSIERSFV